MPEVIAQLDPQPSASPRVSVVVPCYKGARFLAEAIESCLRQTMTDFEVIVVDDASPDECAEIADGFAKRDPRVRVIRRESNGGVSEAFNTGFNAARGRYFTRLAQDDAFTPDALQCLADFLDAHPGVGLTYADYLLMDESGSPGGRVSVPEPDHALLFGNRLGLCVAWRRKVWEEVGGFSRQYDTAEDYEYWLRVWDRFSIEKCRDSAPLFVRAHGEMGSFRFADRQERATLQLLRRHCPAKVGRARWAVLRRKAVSRIFFSAAADYSEQGLRQRALGRVIRSLITWPFPYRRDEVKTSLARLKLLGVLLAGRLRRSRSYA